MSTVYNGISPLPFYTDIAFQNHRKDYAFGQVWPLVTYRNMLLPFQVVLPSNVQSTISWARLLKAGAADSDYTDITKSLNENGLTIKSFSGYRVLKYPATLPVLEIKQEGQYYLIIYVVGVGRLYSDIFTVTNNVSDYALVEYHNSYNFELSFGAVDFTDNFAFKCYLPTQVGKPEYSFEEEATERMGYSFIESQVSKKVFKFTFIAPEYLCDALRIVRMCDSKQITSKGRTYEMASFGMDADWEDQGDLASVECEFETDTVIANIGGYTAELAGGDFNSDYSNDFNIE